jgi:hypothetical protein
MLQAMLDVMLEGVLPHSQAAWKRPMEQNEISTHEVEVWRVFRQSPDRWMTNKDAAALVTGVAPRTVRAKTIKLVTLGLLDQAEVFPAHRYRLSAKAKQRNASYVIRLEKAAEVFGVTLA